MNILTEGQEFELKTALEGKSLIVRFVGRDELGNLVDGITNEELVDMQIERFYALQKRNPCAENKVVILLLKNIRSVLKKRQIRKFNQVNDSDNDK